MFCTLTLEENKKRFSRNLILENKKIGNVEFIKAVIHKPGAIKKLEKKLKNKVDTVILSKNIKNAKFKDIKIYNNEEYLKSIAKYSFQNIINLSKIPANRISVCISDKNLECIDFLYVLSRKCAAIKIVTENIELAETISEEIYEELGVHLIITSEEKDANLGLNLNEKTPKIWFNSTKNYGLITENCVKIGVGFKKFIPKGISESDFAGVLKNYNEFKRLNLIHADRLLKDNKLYKINEENIKNFLDINDNCC